MYKVAHWFEKRFEGECSALEAWKILRFVFLKNLDAKLEKGVRGFCAIALMSVFTKWFSTALVDLLHEEKEPVDWRLHVRAQRGVNREHMQALVTNIFQRRWEWQEDRRTALQPGLYRCNTAFMSSLDVKTGLPIGGQPDNEYVLRGMMWADNYWLFCDTRERLKCKVNDVIDAVGLGMEPKPESLWWTSTQKHVDVRTLRVGGRVKLGIWYK